MRKTIITSALAIAAFYVGCSSCQDAEPVWLQIATTNSATYEADARSLHFIRKDDASVVIAVVGRETTDQGVATASRWVIAADSCDKGEGRSLIADIDGNSVHANNFSAHSNSVASEISRQLCSLYSRKVRPVE